jgi:type I site-specific restriction-modification system R (restriction) subunit
VSLEVMLRGTCAPARLLDIAENFTLFSEHKSGLVKAMAQNHQYLGVNNAIAASEIGCNLLFEHVYDSCDGGRAYAEAA